MNVIGMILRVVVLDYKRRAPNATVVRLAAFTATSPGEEDVRLDLFLACSFKLDSNFASARSPLFPNSKSKIGKKTL